MPRVPRKGSDLRSHKKKTPDAILPADGPEFEPPALPKIGRKWHALTIEWWSDALTGLWASPMAVELAKADIHGLYRVLVLVDDYWKAETPKERTVISGEIRLAAGAYGLDPISRRKLGWRLDVPKPPESPVQSFLQGGRDPREYLRNVTH